jgi:prefoldin subunit 5
VAYGPPAPPTREQEADMLAEQAEWLQAQLDDIHQRLQELKQDE